MEFTPELSSFQGVLISADNMHSFPLLTARGGNEEKLLYIIDKLKNFLQGGKYIDKEGTILKISSCRKFFFYIIVNSDLLFLDEMVNMEDMDLVVWTIPTVAKCLMCEIFWQLKMEKFMYEIITFCTPQLGLEVFDCFVTSIKYFSPEESAEKIKLLSSACYRHICRLHFTKFEDSFMTHLLNQAFNSFQRCLNFITEPPNTHKLINRKKDEIYRYNGNFLHKILLLLYDCFELFITKEQFDAPGFEEIYKLTYKEENLDKRDLDFAICDSQNKLITDYIEKCNTLLLDKCKQLVMDVSVDIFCAWSEFEENGKNMQQTISESFYKLQLLLRKSRASEHPLVTMIEPMSRKPKEIEDIISTANIDTIIDSISRDTENRLLWLQALINNEKLKEDVSFCQHVMPYVTILDGSDCHKFYKILSNHMNRDLENKAEIEELAIKVFQHCCVDNRKEIIRERFANSQFIDMSDNTIFSNNLTEIFNKLISCDTELIDIFNVFIQNPRKVLEKVFNLATENSQQADIMLKIMKLLEEYSNHYYHNETEPCIINITKEVLEHSLSTESQEDNFLNFICGLKCANIIAKARLLLLIVMPKMHEALLNKDTRGINLQTKLLYSVYNLEELMEYRAPMLVIFGQILDTVRWKINTFDSQAPAIIQMVLEMQQLLIGAYNEIPENEELWLKSKLGNSQPLNMYYYRKLWNPPGDSYIEITSGISLNQDLDKEQLTAWLAQVLCATIQQEWCEIWDSMGNLEESTVYSLFHDALSMISVAERPNRTDKTKACLFHCYKNFIYITRHKLFRGELQDSQVQSFAMKISATTNLMDPQDIEEFGVILMPLLGFLAETRNQYSVDISYIVESESRYQEFINIVSNVFSNGVA